MWSGRRRRYSFRDANRGLRRAWHLRGVVESRFARDVPAQQTARSRNAQALEQVWWRAERREQPGHMGGDVRVAEPAARAELHLLAHVMAQQELIGVSVRGKLQQRGDALRVRGKVQEVLVRPGRITEQVQLHGQPHLQRAAVRLER